MEKYIKSFIHIHSKRQAEMLLDVVDEREEDEMRNIANQLSNIIDMDGAGQHIDSMKKIANE